MELHDYRANATTRQAEVLRRFRRAEAIGITLRRGNRHTGRSRGEAPANAARTTTAIATADLQHGS